MGKKFVLTFGDDVEIDERDIERGLDKMGFAGNIEKVNNKVDIGVQFVIDKLVEELNSHVDEGDINYHVLYDEEVDEINEAIQSLGIDTHLASRSDFSDDEEDE